MQQLRALAEADHDEILFRHQIDGLPAIAHEIDEAPLELLAGTVENIMPRMQPIEALRN
jgi:hypothetical protein